MANFEYAKDEQGKITGITVNGKAVKASFLNAFKKAQDTRFFILYTGERNVFQNPFSGVEVTLNALEATIYNWCNQWYRRYEQGAMPTPIQTFDNMKYFLCNINSSAYMDLLD